MTLSNNRSRSDKLKVRDASNDRIDTLPKVKYKGRDLRKPFEIQGQGYWKQNISEVKSREQPNRNIFKVKGQEQANRNIPEVDHYWNTSEAKGHRNRSDFNDEGHWHKTHKGQRSRSELRGRGNRLSEPVKGLYRSSSLSNTDRKSWWDSNPMKHLSLDRMDKIHCDYPTETIMSTDSNNKPKTTKSVHFAPDVKYVCRENRNKPVKRNHSTTNALNASAFLNENEQLPAVVEKYMIRSLPAFKAHTDNVIYVDSTSEGVWQKSDLNGNVQKPPGRDHRYGRSPLSPRRGLVVHTRELNSEHLPPISSVDITDRLTLHRSNSTKPLSNSLPNIPPVLDKSTCLTSAALSRENHKPPRMVFTVHTNVHDKKRPSISPRSSPREDVKYNGNKRYNLSFCAL